MTDESSREDTWSPEDIYDPEPPKPKKRPSGRKSKFGHKNKFGRSNSPVEEAQPEKTAEFIELVSNPLVSVNEAAARCGLPHGTAYRLLKRLRTKYAPVVEATRKVTTDTLLESLGNVAQKIIDSIDPLDIEEASLKDKTIAFGILVDKRQLLSGQPTQILSVEERRNLDQLLPALIAEAEKRGLVTDAEFEVIDGPSGS